MLRIGEFSQLSQVTVKTLRHYDNLGLIQPIHIDPFTNYRYYSLEQLPRIHRIMALKEIGLSLEQIRLMLEEALPAEQIRGMLRLKQNEAEQQIREAKRRQDLIAFRLHMIESEDDFPELDVVIKKLDAQRFLSRFVPAHASPQAGKAHRDQTATAIRTAIESGQIHYTGAIYDVFHGETILPFLSDELRDDQHELLIGVTAQQKATEFPGAGHWHIKEAPEIGSAATLIVSGSKLGPITVVEKVTLLRRWALSHQYKPDNFVRYRHHRGPLDTPDTHEWLIEIQLPITLTEAGAQSP